MIADRGIALEVITDDVITDKVIPSGVIANRVIAAGHQTGDLQRADKAVGCDRAADLDKTVD